MTPERRLAVYGTLAPGQPNHGQLAALAGDWRPGEVCGWRVESGWGDAAGFPGLRPDPAGPAVRVQVFTSPDLPDHWSRLDQWEGAEYERVVVEARTEDGVILASLYALRPEPKASGR